MFRNFAIHGENKPATAPLGQIICITDVGKMVRCGEVTGQSGWFTLNQIFDLSAAVVLTGTTIERQHSQQLPILRDWVKMGKLNFYILDSDTNNANKTLRVVKMAATTLCKLPHH